MNRPLLVLAATAALLAAPAEAHAAVTCDYSSTGKVLTVTVVDADARLRVVGGEIKVGGFSPDVTCTGPGGHPL